MAVRWHSLPVGEKISNLHYPQKIKKKRITIAEEENGLKPERVHARHLDLRLTP